MVGRTEHDEQKALIWWFDNHFKALKGRLAAVPNGGERNKIVAAKLRAEGVRKGFPDLVLLTPRHGYHGLIIEMKREKGGTVSKEQQDWIDWLNIQGYRAVVCRGFEEGRSVIKEYLAAEATAV